ncbi:MAG: YebC/PmpR family DNA-binding transcriptional regulator [Lachnoclostridium sp.]|jgi:YebC/PmpR family DNA-binding regulatory protein|nr:YebC/PmpR family DNA-binding transcriptional regulator [Lachnoclostridium sp.]
MSGHSKYSNIKHKKEKKDAIKGKVFTVLGREIAVAVKEGGADPESNSRLRDVITKAKANNMPNDTIERGIKKAAGDLSAVAYESVTYEGYGPKGTAFIVKALTDNKNRTASNVRNAFTKGGGSVGTKGCVSYMFHEKGQILVTKEDYAGSSEDLMITALDAGAEDFIEDEDYYEIVTTPENLESVRARLESENIIMLQAQVTMIPQTSVCLEDSEDIKNFDKTMDLLEADDDVYEVCHNLGEVEFTYPMYTTGF